MSEHPKTSNAKREESNKTNKSNKDDVQARLFALAETGQLQDFIKLSSTTKKKVAKLTDRLKRTVLHIAVLKAHIPVINYLLNLESHPCDPNAVDQHKQSVLHYAAHTGDSDVFTILKKHAVNLNSKDVFGRTALHHAAMQGSVSSIQWLVDNALGRSDTLMKWINQKDMLGSNALHWAAVKGKHDVVKYLVARGINVHLRAGDSQTAAGLALQAYKDQVHTWLRGYITYGSDVMKYVEHRLKGGVPLSKDKDISTLNTSQGGSSNNSNSSSKNREDARRDTLVDVRAALQGHIKAFDKWKSTERADGCFIQFYRNRHGMTALHAAAKYGDYLVVSELIHTHHFCVSSMDHYGRTPLHYASLYGHSQVALLLTHVSRGYREEDTYRHFVQGDPTNGTKGGGGGSSKDASDDDLDTDVRVAHWKLKTATDLLPSQMAHHGYVHHVHSDKELSTRLSLSENEHAQSLSVFQSGKDDIEYNADSMNCLGEEMYKARRQLVTMEEDNTSNTSNNGETKTGLDTKSNNDATGNEGNGGIDSKSNDRNGTSGGGGGGGGSSSSSSSSSTTTTSSSSNNSGNGSSSSNSSNIISSSNNITTKEQEITGNNGAGNKTQLEGDELGRRRNDNTTAEAPSSVDTEHNISNSSSSNNNDDGNDDDTKGSNNSNSEGDTEQDTKQEDEAGRQDVKNWLECLKLSQYTEKFLKNGWETTDALVLIQKSDLDAMEVLPGHSAVILKNIQERKGVS